jgi:L-threonylcarbamoyladenylate synthase
MEKEISLIKNILSGKIFIYPTDTVYGLGCNALDKKVVEKIKEIKSRDRNKPLSIIAPSKEWIYKNTEAKKAVVDKYLPGRYTLILKKKKKNFLNHVSDSEFLGIRIPGNDFCKIIQKSGVPFITTSVNLSGERPAIRIEDIKKEILEKADIAVNAGKLHGKPSTIILSDGTVMKR